MTIADLHQNEELRQHEFPVTRDRIFLGHAGVCPLPRRVAHALQTYSEESTHGDQETLIPAFQLQASRALAAGMLGGQPDEIAFVGPTSLALSFIAGGLRFRRTDHVLVYLDDYPSNVYPWMALAERGVEVRFLNVRELGRIRPVDVLGQVDEGTKLVALASAHFIAGYRVDVDAIGAALRERGILFSLDAIQTVGAFPTSTRNVDFLAADAHKWMLGPCAAGLLFVRREVQERLHPIVFGWNNVRSPGFVAQEEMELRSGAARYEAGSHNLLGLVGLNAALGLLHEIGIEQIGTELLRKRAWLVPALMTKGYIVLQANAPTANASGIVSFFKPDTDMRALHATLEAARILTSLRTDRTGQAYIRLSPHFYNTDAELHRVLEQL
jgi:selenocysteine lyase/cysteine desulfurase